MVEGAISTIEEWVGDSVDRAKGEIDRIDARWNSQCRVYVFQVRVPDKIKFCSISHLDQYKY